MKKSHIIIIIGILFLASGIYLYTSKKNPMTYIESTLSREKAISLMESLLEDAILVYEKPEEYFKVTEEEGLLKLHDYDEKIGKIFTESGKTYLENVMIGDKKLITKNESGTYILKPVKSENSIYGSTISFKNVNITNSKVDSEVTFSSDELDSDGNVLYKIVTKNVSLAKENDNFLIDVFK